MRTQLPPPRDPRIAEKDALMESAHQALQRCKRAGISFEEILRHCDVGDYVKPEPSVVY